MLALFTSILGIDNNNFTISKLPFKEAKYSIVSWKFKLMKWHLNQVYFKLYWKMYYDIPLEIQFFFKMSLKQYVFLEYN